MEKEMDVNAPIEFPCDEKEDAPRVYTVPDGNYALTAWSVSLSKSRKGDPLMNVRFGINGHKGEKWLYHNITLLPKGSPGHGITVHALKTLGFSVDKSVVNFRPSDIIGRICRAEIKTEEYDGTTKSGNPIKKHKNVIKEMAYPDTADKPEMPPSPMDETEKKNTEDLPF